jgi:hypothetical protein
METRDRTSERCEHRPPQNNSGQNEPWAEAVGHPSAWNFKHAVCHRERTNDSAPFLGTNVQIFLDTRPSNRNADAVEEGNDRKKKQERPDFVSILHRPHPRNRERLPLTSVKHQRGAGTTIPGRSSATLN